MNKWTGVVAAALSTLVLVACGGMEDASSPEDTLAEQKAGIDVCGNGICYSSELNTCPQDCYYGGYCGDGRCTSPENSTKCPSDCRAGCFAPEEQDPKEPDQTLDVCGNGICYSSELNMCPQDCYYGGYCGDGRCTSPESSTKCPSDCKTTC